MRLRDADNGECTARARAEINGFDGGARRMLPYIFYNTIITMHKNDDALVIDGVFGIRQEVCEVLHLPVR